MPAQTAKNFFNNSLSRKFGYLIPGPAELRRYDKPSHSGPVVSIPVYCLIVGGSIPFPQLGYQILLFLSDQLLHLHYREVIHAMLDIDQPSRMYPIEPC